MKHHIITSIVIIMSVMWGFLWWLISMEAYPQIKFKATEENKSSIEDLQTANVVELQNEIIKVWNSVSESVVSIIVKKDLQLFRQSPFWPFWPSLWTVSQEVSWWTWFFIDEEWTILTNKHVINNNWDDYTVVTKSWEEFDAEILWIDQLTDLAVIKINPNKPTPQVTFVNNEEEVTLGQFAIAIWNALSKFQNSVTLWIISWKNRSIEVWQGERLNGLIQTDAAINPWNSWGPLLSIDWKVMWINTAISWRASGIWFAIPLSERRVDYIKSSIENYGKIKRAFLGVEIIPINTYTKANFNISADYWNYVNNVMDDSNAAKAWIKKWDIILEADWEKLVTKTLTDLIQNKIPWDQISLKIYTDDEIKDITVKIGEL